MGRAQYKTLLPARPHHEPSVRRTSLLRSTCGSWRVQWNSATSCLLFASPDSPMCRHAMTLSSSRGIEAGRLAWVRTHQKELRADQYKNVREFISKESYSALLTRIICAHFRARFDQAHIEDVEHLTYSPAMDDKLDAAMLALPSTTRIGIRQSVESSTLCPPHSRGHRGTCMKCTRTLWRSYGSAGNPISL